MKSLPLAFFVFLAAAASLQAQTYTWDGTTDPNASGNWSTATNWSSDIVPGAGNTAVLGNVTTGTRVVTYDTAAPTTLGGLQFNQTTAGATNELAIQLNGLTINSDVTVGAAAGASLMYLNVTSTATPSLILATTGGVRSMLTIGANGTFELENPGTSSTVNANVTISGGAFNVERGLTTSSVNASAISGTLTMSSGTLTLGATPLNGTGQSTDNRFQVGGNASLTGGSIVQGPGASSVFFGGATNDISGLTANPTMGFSLNANSTVQSLNLGAVSISSLTLRAQNLTNFTAVKTVSATTGTTGAIVLLEQTTGARVQFTLGSNLSATSLQAANFSEAATVNFTVETGATTGFTLNLTSGGFAPGNGMAGTAAAWTLQGLGTFKATTIDLSQATGGVSTAGNVTLQATGGNSTANNLGNASGGTVASTSTFLYSGSAVAATPATLATTRSIGSLTVQTGALRLSQATTAAGTGVTINTGGNLDLNAFNLTATSAALTLSSTGGGGTIRNSTATTSATPATLSAASMTFNPGGVLTYTLGTADNTTNMLISLTGNFTKGTSGTGSAYSFLFNGGQIGQTYDLVNYGTTSGTTSFAASDFTASGSNGALAGTFAFNTVNGVQQLDFTVTAVPEPAVTSLLAGAVSLGALAFRLRRARRFATPA